MVSDINQGLLSLIIIYSDMSIQPIPIDKKEFIHVLEATGFTIDITNIELNKSANILISFYNKDGCLIKTDCCALIQPEYNLWTTDEWLIEYVCSVYGLSIRGNHTVSP